MTSNDERRAEVSRYFRDSGYLPDDSISVVWKARSGKLGWTHVLVSEAYKTIVGHMLVDCWISANPMTAPVDKESRGTAADVYAVRALWADLDVGPGKMPSYAAARAVIAEVSELIGAQPTVLLASGHGLQPRWKLDNEGMTADEQAVQLVEDFGRLVQRTAEKHGGKADSVYDLPRIIRAPGTRNCKDSQSGIEVKVKFTGTDDLVTVRRLTDALASAEQQAPQEPVTELVPKAENVDLRRGNAYAKSIYDAIRGELAEIADWPDGKTDDRGRGWEKIQADAAYRLAELAKADWNKLTLEQAKKAFCDWAPVGGNWTMRDVVKKWNAQSRRAEPALPPAENPDDPLSPGYRGTDASPHSGASGEGAGGGAAEGDRPGGESDPRAGDASDEDDRRLDRGELPASGSVDGRAVADPVWRKFEWNDRGNADRIAHLWGSTLRWSPGLGRWLRYTDGAWRETETGGEQAFVELLERLPKLEADLYSKEEYQKTKGKVSSQYLDFLEWVDDQKSTAKAQAAAKMVRFVGELQASPLEFDNNPMLLNARNGVIDLRTGELLEHDPSLMLRRQVPVEFDPDAKAPMWEAYLQRVMPYEGQRSYLQRVTGYSITGRTSEQVMFLHHGVTHNGKGVYLQVLEATLGEFSRVVPPTALLSKRETAHPTDIMGLEGRRMLQLDEVAEGARLDEALIKRLTGQSTITARGMGQDFQDFRVKGKIHMVVNHLPHMSDDLATRRRIKMVTWGVTIPFEERDQFLAEKIIAAELPGVLAWAVRGAAEWHQKGLMTPPELELAAGEYFASEDEFGVFLEEELIIGAESFTPSKVVYQRYAQWCDSMRMKPMSAIAFGRKLSARGVPPARTTAARGWAVVLQTHGWQSLDPLA